MQLCLELLQAPYFEPSGVAPDGTGKFSAKQSLEGLINKFDYIFV